MTPDRERAMAALRAWAAPGARARLLEQAWRAGETNIAALADAAGVTRPTVYADLESRGINPRTDRQETPTMQTITVGPYTGAETTEQRNATLNAIMAKYQQAAADGALSTADAAAAWAEESRTDLRRYEAARYHNTLLPYARREADAREAAHRALHRVETAWAALRTARAWMAAHHCYVETVADAGTAIDTWITAAQETQAQHDNFVARTFGDLAREGGYEQHVAEPDRITVGADTATLARVELEETAARRRAIAAETLRLAAGAE
jgi:hypothetical protein